MSTDFRITNKRVPVSDLLDGRLDAFSRKNHDVRLSPSEVAQGEDWVLAHMKAETETRQ